MKRLLIFNADDYGLSPAVSAGIRAAARGVVRSTTVMCNLAGAAEIAQLGRSRLGAGVHLNLSCGPPLSRGYPAALLKSDGSFDKALALSAATWEDPRHAAAAQAEWQAQLAWARSSGLTPTHLDSHHHAHLLPPLFPLALELARRERLPLRVRPAQVAAARAAGVATPDDLCEGFFGAGNLTLARLGELLYRAKGRVIEVMCHPGLSDAQLRQRSGYTSERVVEMICLGNRRLARLLEVCGWQIGDYRCLRK